MPPEDDRRQSTRRQPDNAIVVAAGTLQSVIVPALKAANKYGIAQLIALVVVAFLMFMNYRMTTEAKQLDPQIKQQLDVQLKQIETTNQMLQRHMDATQINAVVAYLTCVRLTTLTGEQAEMCSVPGFSR